jgi:hypothetical protein
VEALSLSLLFGGTYTTHARRVAIWGKAAPIPGCDKAIWRCDDQGRVIRWADYGDRFSRYGWVMVVEPHESRLARALGLIAARPVHLNETDAFHVAPLQKAA